MHITLVNLIEIALKSLVNSKLTYLSLCYFMHWKHTLEL